MKRIACLDGLRGLAALWVVLGHAAILCRFHIPIVSSPDQAVNLFMILSGFLMTFHAFKRQEREPLERLDTWFAFWIRRIFRIAPVYYLLLAVALLMGPSFGVWREHIAVAFPETITNTARYTDNSWANITEHVTFLFGFSPYYEFRTVLPDWSIGLEMQFYLFFPFLMLAFTKIGPLKASAIFILICLSFWEIVPQFLRSFQMPALLSLKLNMFLAGMLLAVAHSKTKGSAWSYVVGAVIAAIIPLNNPFHPVPKLIIFFVVLIVGLLVLCEQAPEAFGIRSVAVRLADILGKRQGHFLAEMSYSVYLLHLLIMLPIASYIAGQGGWFHYGIVRWSACLILVLPISYFIAWALSQTIEAWGIRVGHHLAKSVITVASATEAV